LTSNSVTHMTITPEEFINARLDEDQTASATVVFPRDSVFGSARHIANNDEGGTGRGHALALTAKHWDAHPDYDRIDWSNYAETR
jgi:hypothetical protein